VSGSTLVRERRALRLCGWCVVAVAVEVALYLSYRGHDARFHVPGRNLTWYIVFLGCMAFYLAAVDRAHARVAT